MDLRIYYNTLGALWQQMIDNTQRMEQPALLETQLADMV